MEEENSEYNNGDCSCFLDHSMMFYYIQKLVSNKFEKLIIENIVIGNRTISDASIAITLTSNSSQI